MRIITDEMIMKFKNHLTEEEKCKNTIEKYVRDINVFRIWTAGQELCKSLILEYKSEIIKCYAATSVNSMLSAINSFFEFIGWDDLKVKTLKIQRKIFANEDKELTKAEYERLLTAAKRRKSQCLYYLIQTLCSTGIRISELSAITVNAVKKGQAFVNCKGKMRTIMLPKALCKMLKDYIKSNRISNGSVFVSRSGKPLDRSYIWKMLKGLCKNAKVSRQKVFPHNFRHLFARTFYAIQKDIVRLADILGHSSINTTRLYTIESGASHLRQLQKLGLLRV